MASRGDWSRRSLIATALGGLASACGSRAAEQDARNEALNAVMHAMQAAQIDKLPGERIEVAGRDALQTWRELRGQGQGWPVIIGGPDNLARIVEQAAGDLGDASSSPDVILRTAAGLQHPASLLEHLRAEAEDTRAFLEGLPPERRSYTQIVVGSDGQRTEATRDVLDDDPGGEPEMGDWPSSPPEPSKLAVLYDLVRSPGGEYVNQLIDRATLLRLPTNDQGEVLAQLRWGGWNACPLPEYHVAALRSWSERYGAELVALSGDTLELQVKRRPATRDEAIALAKELYAYCPDLIDQGYEGLAPMAAALMSDDLWSFWWD